MAQYQKICTPLFWPPTHIFNNPANQPLLQYSPIVINTRTIELSINKHSTTIVHAELAIFSYMLSVLDQ